MTSYDYALHGGAYLLQAQPRIYVILNTHTHAWPGRQSKGQCNGVGAYFNRQGPAFGISGLEC